MRTIKAIIPVGYLRGWGADILLLLGIISFSQGCSAPAQILRESSIPVRPDWILMPPPSSQTMYFVGIASGVETLEAGREAALKDAYAKIAGFLGSKVQSVFTEHSTELEQRISQQVSSKSNASIQGAEAVDWYYEKVTRVDKKFRMEKYDVYVLVSFQKGEVDKELQRQQKERAEKVATAYTLYGKGKDAENHKTYVEARHFFQQALTILEPLDDIVVMENSEVKNSTELTQLVKTRLQTVISNTRRLVLFIQVKGSEQESKAFQSSLASVLSEQGFTVTHDDPAIEIRGEISVSESSYVMNNMVFYAEGNVSARRISDGQVIAVVPVKAKGFHRNPDQAALNALVEGGSEAGKRLTRILLEKENPPDR